jgi:hypothetical protein
LYLFLFQDWISVGGAVGGVDAAALQDDGNKRKRKKSKSGNGKPTLTIGLPTFGSNSIQVRTQSYKTFYGRNVVKFVIS